MATWTTSAKVERYLLASHGLTLSTYIDEASDYVAAHLDTQYWRFPDAGSTPDCPEIIQAVTALRAAYMARMALGTTNRFDQEGTTQQLKADFLEELAALKNGSTQVPPTLITGETIAYGDGDPWGITQHVFWPAQTDSFEVIPGSARIADQKVPEDFDVFWSEANQRWYLQSYNTTAIVDGVSTVSYEISWFRRRDVDQSVSGTPARINFVG